jgi:catechol 2,3-dioxygenase-like lactoylglutathione lyase family enzyme
LTAKLYNHVGIVVADMGEARKRFSELLGLTFTDVASVDVESFQEAGQPPRPLQLELCYSLDGPPHYELIAATGHGVYGPRHVGGVHHIGFAEADVGQRLRDLAEYGVNFEALFRTEDDPGRLAAAYLDPDDVLGVRLELTWSGRGTFVERYRAERGLDPPG